MAQSAYNYRHQQARQVQLEQQPWCEDCGEPATVADHQPPLSRHDHEDGTGCCVYRSQCAKCSLRQAGQLGGETFRQKMAEAAAPDWEEPDGVAQDDPRWRVDWLQDLLDVPVNATWPRFATLPHPDAVGSYGPAVEALALADHGVEFRWWQRLFLRLLLQHDADGNLLFGWCLLTAARQSGKTVCLAELAWWRMGAAAMFDGDRQQVVHTARTLTPALDTIGPILRELLVDPDYRCSRAAGLYEIAHGRDGWRVLSQKNVYGQSASLGIVDEGWGVKASDITESLEPTIVERIGGQLLLVSTAHRRATALMPGRRMEALEQLEQPGRGLIVEWSAPPDCQLDDVAAWRQASPHWTSNREKLMGEILERARRGVSTDPDEPDPIEAFRTQWLNQWRTRVALVRKGEPLVDPDVWRTLEVDLPRFPTGTAAMAIEDYHGNGYGAVLVGEIDDGRLLARCWTFERRQALIDWLLSVVALPTLIAGVSLAQDRDLLKAFPGVVRHGTTETGLSLPLLRELVSADRVRHVGSDALSEQIRAFQVASTSGGLRVASKDRDDLVRCCAWAARYVDQGLADPGGIS